MTIDEYKDLMLEDEINIGCYVEEDMTNYLANQSQDILYINFIFGGCHA